MRILLESSPCTYLQHFQKNSIRKWFIKKSESFHESLILNLTGCHIWRITACSRLALDKQVLLGNNWGDFQGRRVAGGHFGLGGCCTRRYGDIFYLISDSLQMSKSRFANTFTDHLKWKEETPQTYLSSTKTGIWVCAFKLRDFQLWTFYEQHVVLKRYRYRLWRSAADICCSETQHTLFTEANISVFFRLPWQQLMTFGGRQSLLLILSKRDAGSVV